MPDEPAKPQVMVNVGCGREYRPGWVNLDASKAVKAEHYLILGRDELPFEDGEADRIYISGVLEQIGPNPEFLYAMNELHRILKDGGIMVIVVPNARYDVAHLDPMDVRKFIPESFDYFLRSSKKYMLYGKVYGFAPWRKLKVVENSRHILTIAMKK